MLTERLRLSRQRSLEDFVALMKGAERGGGSCEGPTEAMEWNVSFLCLFFWCPAQLDVDRAATVLPDTVFGGCYIRVESWPKRKFKNVPVDNRISEPSIYVV